MGDPRLMHENLLGAERDFRYRMERIGSERLLRPLTLSFSADGRRVTCQVLDVARRGAQIAQPADLDIIAGATLEQLRLQFGDEIVWEGQGVVVWSLRSRIGIRFPSSVVDLRHLTEIAPDGREAAIADNNCLREFDLLPVDYVRAVLRLRDRFLLARSSMNRLESGAVNDKTAGAIIASYYDLWAPGYIELMEYLFKLTRHFKEDQRAVGVRFATNHLLEFWIASPMLKRVYDKPLNYAGDHVVMSMYQSSELLGDSLFGKFVTYLARKHSLGRAVSVRKRLIRDVFDEIRCEGPHRIVSLACGPASELAEFVRELDESRAYHLVLVDQDSTALDEAAQQIQRALDQRGEPNVQADFYHFSVKQLLQPSTEEESKLAGRILGNADLIYSIGLFDYLRDHVAYSLARKLYDHVKPGGRLFVGNLRAAPDVSFGLEYVVDWQLIYRTPAELSAIGASLPGSSCQIRFDETGFNCFLEAKRDYRPV